MELCRGNRYVATLHAINRCIVKLGKITSAQKLYRGISGLRLPESFFIEDAPFADGGYGSGTMGGVEHASTSHAGSAAPQAAAHGRPSQA